MSDHAVANPAISARELTKRYSGRAVVDSLSFEVKRGEIFALLGPNGAGKTTTIEMLEGYRSPDAGTVRVLDLDPVADGPELKSRVGLMLQEGGIYQSIKTIEALTLFSSFYQDPLEPRSVLRWLDLEDVAETRYRQLSGGQKQRLSLGIALIGQPELVFLDEPTSGMDPRARHATWEIVLGLKAKGVTVMLTTHFMEEAERLADRVAIVDRGRLVGLDTPSALGQGTAHAGIRFRASQGLALDGLADRIGARSVTENRPGEYVIDVDATPATVTRLAEWLEQRELLAIDIRLSRHSLEDVFLRLTDSEDE